MKKLSLTVIGFYLGILASFSQNTSDTAYKNRKLTLDEIDFVSGYYQQDGQHSAVTGGKGTEKLNDLANSIELRFSRYDRKSRKHTINFELGIDHYTSASSDKIDPYTISSASYADTRIYPSVGWTVQDEQKGTTLGLTGSLSKEFDYTSVGIGASFTKTSKDNNQEFTAKAQAYFDRWKVIYPIELRRYASQAGGDDDDDDYGSSPRNSFSTALSFSKVLNQRLQLALVTEPVLQSGLLATKYQRVYFSDGSVQAENLPDSRIKIPVSVRANFFLGDRLILRSFYRYYLDNWGVKAHTVDFETAIKLSPFFSISPFYRFYSQSAADYFGPYAAHSLDAVYYTSDYDLSKFRSHYFGAGFRIVPANGILGMRHISSMEWRGGRYTRTDGLSSYFLSLHLTFK